MNEFAYALWCGRLSHALDYLLDACENAEPTLLNEEGDVRLEAAWEAGDHARREFHRAFNEHKGTLAAPRLVSIESHLTADDLAVLRMEDE